MGFQTLKHNDLVSQVCSPGTRVPFLSPFLTSLLHSPALVPAAPPCSAVSRLSYQVSISSPWLTFSPSAYKQTGFNPPTSFKEPSLNSSGPLLTLTSLPFTHWDPEILNWTTLGALSKSPVCTKPDPLITLGKCSRKATFVSNSLLKEHRLLLLL